MPLPLNFAAPAISIDVEDWPQSSWDRSLPVTPRAATNTLRVLDLLVRARVRATMFVLGKFAETFPDVVRRIHDAGHEVASHGHGHIETFHLSPAAFRADIRRSKAFLEQLLGVRVRGYRAPDFSVIRSTLWALEILAEEGFDYDSSIFPIHARRYGIPDWPRSPTTVELAGGGTIVEFPIATARALGRNWPIGGGGYHRLLPGSVSRCLAGWVLKSMPFVFYCHPYEFDPQEFAEIALPIPRLIRLHQGLGRGRFQIRFLAFVKRFGGTRIVDLLDGFSWPGVELGAIAPRPVPDGRAFWTEQPHAGNCDAFPMRPAIESG